MRKRPRPPQRKEPSRQWEHYALWKRVVAVLKDIPKHFESTISVSGIRATEIFTYGQVLSSTIEEEIVRTLNDLRDHWGDEGQADYMFTRQPQTFPDVLLSTPNRDRIVMGLEIKSWYLLAKEDEPTFRFKVSPDCCAENDLFVVVPWALSNVLSGTPIIFEPFVELARYIAEYRNYWWKHVRETNDSTQITPPPGAAPYPAGRDESEDKPAYDGGGNFGRIARTGIMDDYVRQLKTTRLIGFSVARWTRFFKENNSAE